MGKAPAKKKKAAGPARDQVCACVPAPPATGSWMLVSINGVLDWMNLETPAAAPPKTPRKS